MGIEAAQSLKADHESRQSLTALFRTLHPMQVPANFSATYSEKRPNDIIHRFSGLREEAC